MKKTIYVYIAFFIMLSVAHGQERYDWGSKFPFDAVAEMDPTFVLKDNYNTYLFSALNYEGMLSKHQMLLRKFDQKNKLVETLSYDFPALDANTFHDYLGFVEGSNGKLAAFTKTYSKKALKSIIYMHEFDKTTNQFKSTELFSVPIISNSKSGDVKLVKSASGYFTGINYRLHKEKDAPEKNHMIVLDDKLATVWQKDFEFSDKYVTHTFAVTPSGKIAYLRKASGWKNGNYLVYASSEGQEVKNIETDIILHEPQAIAIGAQEYVLAFNHPAKGLRSGSFNNLLLFDLLNGRTVNNSSTSQINEGNLEDVLIRHISVLTNEIHIFTEGMIEIKAPPGSPTPGPGQVGFMEKIYNYGPANMIVLSSDGTLKGSTKFNINEYSRAKIHHSYGLLNIKGTYWLNAGVYDGINDGVYALDPKDQFNRDLSKSIYINTDLDPDHLGRNFMTQLFTYFPDSNKWLLARTTDNNTQMSLVGITK